MAFLKTLPLSQQPTPVLVALCRQLATPVDANGNVSPAVRGLLGVLHSRNYPLKNLF